MYIMYFVNSDVLGMRQIFLATGLQSWLKASFVALALLSFSRACEYHNCMHGHIYRNDGLCKEFPEFRYGIGYHMTMVKDASCDSSQVEHLVESLVPKAEQVTDVGAELSYILPSSATPSFPELFNKLETEKKTLGIVSFGISVTTMEEVFMKVGEEATEDTLNDRYLHMLHVEIIVNEYSLCKSYYIIYITYASMSSR